MKEKIMFTYTLKHDNDCMYVHRDHVSPRKRKVSSLAFALSEGVPKSSSALVIFINLCEYELFFRTSFFYQFVAM
jgi:hypothetical protein